MSNEESYLAIIRYLTDEREPYAPGTPGNTKRKIRKAAICYVVRDGKLLYQRRIKGQDNFAELEVVLQDERRKELINQAHINDGGEHLNQNLTWDYISNKYWWRGIMKNVKDIVRECAHCQSRRSVEDAQGARRRAASRFVEDTDEDLDEEGGDGLNYPGGQTSAGAVAKHQLVFVDSKGEVNQFLSDHGQTMLNKLNEQRVSNQFCDITLLIEGEEYRAHKAVLAACSEYFKELFFEKGATTTHEAVIELSGFTKATFLPLLDFAYTSLLSFNFCIMADIANLARHLLMNEVLQICESVHKQVEEQKLTVYQQGDIHTVLTCEAGGQEAPSEESGIYTVTINGDGRAMVTHSGAPGEPVGFVDPEQAVVTESTDGDVAQMVVDGQAETVTLISHGVQSQQEGGVTVISHCAEDMAEETMTVVTHSGQAGASESLAVVSACLAMDQPQAEEALLVNIDRVSEVEEEKEGPQEGPQEAAAALEPPAVVAAPRKRGRPAKVKKALEEFVPVKLEDSYVDESQEEDQMMSDDTKRRRLRQRSMVEGGYARLHMGTEEEEEDKVAPSPAGVVTTKVSPVPKRRGRPPKQPVQSQAPSGVEPSTVESSVVEVAAAAAQLSTDMAEADLGQAQTEASEDVRPAEGAVEGEHTCAECGLSFQRRYSLIMHSLKHEKSRGYKCSMCNKEFQYAASLRAHLARHKKKTSQRVPAKPPSDPGAENGDGSKLEDKSPNVKREFVCDICGKTLPKLYSLRIHMLNHTGVRPHSCKVCGKSFTHKHSLKMHRALHDVSKQFQCQYCQKTFMSRRSMEEHTSLHTGESKYLCNTCGETFFRASTLSKHLKKHKPRPETRQHACKHCDKKFFEAKDLQQHMNKHLGLKPFQCQVCGKCYSWKKDWYSHVKSHSVAEPYKCNVCGKEFFEKALFRRHVKKATHGKKGRIKQNLERKCEQCGRKFTQLREYRRHINNHQGVKPFECLTCGVAWADARSLKRHVRTHTGERPYVCPLCHEAHIDARTLRKHMSKYHEANLPCKIMLEKDTLQFHNQGTQVEHAVSILSSDLPPELRPAEEVTTEEIETVLITDETMETVGAVEAVQTIGEAPVSTLSDQSIMQVVNYVLAQQALTGAKLEEEEEEEEVPEAIQTMEMEVAHVTEVE